MRESALRAAPAASRSDTVIENGVRGSADRMADYMEYAEGAAGEDQPLYLFDKAILSLAAPLGGDYQARAAAEGRHGFSRGAQR